MDVFTLAAKLQLDSSEFESGIKQNEGRFKQFGQKLGSAAKKVAKVGGVAMVAAGTAVGAFMKKALDARGALEQAMGGAEAVFGKYSKSMVAQAKDAYETMGLSQREFLETSNKLGSLLQGSGYKEAEAAKTATKVMQRASDVASIMGIDVADAMTAVTAAAKGNFTMMDNLGVAINETTLESYAQAKGIKKSYKEMTTAEKVGLAYQLFLEKTAKYAGNYAKENETYAGSINTLKKAWENFMSGSGSAKAVVTSLKRVVKVIWKNITELAPELAKGLGEMVKTAFKSIKWPAWHDVKVYAKRAWESIQKGLNSLGGLIFGKNKKGQVKWPTWNDVKSAAVSAWNAIKKEAETAAARILGSLGIPVITKMGKQGQEDIIIWPSWEDVRESAIQAWENIKAKAAAIVDEAGALVFGRKEDGTVAWPTWEDVKVAAGTAWESISDGLGTITKWILNTPEMPSANEVGQAINKWLSDNVKAFIQWAIGDPAIEDYDGSNMVQAISAWWDNFIKPLLGGILNFTLGLFGLPSVEEMVQKVSDWWNGADGVVAKVKNAITAVIPTDVGNSLITQSLQMALDSIGKKEEVAGKLLDELTKIGDVSKASAEKQAEWKSVATELIGLFPSLGDAINIETMQIKGNTNEIKENITQYSNLARERAIQSAKEKQMENMTNANLAIIEKQVQLEQTRNALKGEEQALIDNVNKALLEYGFTANVTAENLNAVYTSMIPIIESSDEYDGLAKAFGGASTGVGKLKTNITALEAEIANNQKQLENAKAEYSAWEAAINSLFDAVKSGAGSAGSSIDGLGSKIKGLPTRKNITIAVNYQNNGGLSSAPNKRLDTSENHAVMNAKGNYDVPYDNYPALLHRNEMVLTASQARQYREGKNSNLDLGSLTRAIVSAVREGMENAHVNTYLDGKEVTDNVSRRMANEFKAMRYAT